MNTATQSAGTFGATMVALLLKRSMQASIKAPEASRSVAKLAGSMLACCSARRHKTELAAKASIASVVNHKMRQEIKAAASATRLAPDTGQPGLLLARQAGRAVVVGQLCEAGGQ